VGNKIPDTDGGCLRMRSMRFISAVASSIGLQMAKRNIFVKARTHYDFCFAWSRC